jgi:hypothetical protein
MSTLGLLYLLASALTFGLGIAHSFLGERYILIRLSGHPDVSKIFRRPEVATRTLRFAWHLTTVAWWGASALFFLMAQSPLSTSTVAIVLAVVFLLSGAITLFASRGRHLAWPLFFVIGLIALYGSGA